MDEDKPAVYRQRNPEVGADEIGLVESAQFFGSDESSSVVVP